MKVNVKDIRSRTQEHAVRAHSGIVNVCVVGSRTLRDARVVGRVLSRLGNIPLFDRAKTVQFICGMADGADTLGQQWAESRHYKTYHYPPDYEAYKKAAPFKRNIEMAVVTDILIAFWDGKSRGTQHMLNICQDFGLRDRLTFEQHPMPPMEIYCSQTPTFGNWWSNTKHLSTDKSDTLKG
jgi:hypothetical protein